MKAMTEEPKKPGTANKCHWYRAGENSEEIADIRYLSKGANWRSTLYLIKLL